MKHRSWFAGSLLVLLTLIPQTIAAQVAAGTGEIRLQAMDPSGAKLKARGVLTLPGGGTERSFETDASGYVDLRGLAAGRYQIELSQRGFATQHLSLEVGGESPVTRDVVLLLQGGSTTVTVYPATPIGPADLEADQIPVAVQAVSAKTIEDTNAIDLADVLNKRVNGVYINENNGNPYTPDVNYRGYTASALLGTPEGLSVYLDGVRQNQPFGDVVSWDLIPKIAIESAELIPGSNPVYGLNTLGGAIAVQTKSGVTTQGLSVQMTGGKFGRGAIEGEYGGANTRGLNWYVGGNFYHEDGWRVQSSSTVRQSFAKVGLARGKNTFSLTGSYSNNFLTGNGTQDFRFLATDYTSVYSVPDITWNHAPSLTLNFTREVSSNLSFSGNTYFRYVRADTTNGDINDDSFDQSLYNLSAADIRNLTAAGYRGFPTTGNAMTQPFPYWRCIAQGLAKNEPAEKCTGIITNTRTQQNNYGMSGLVSWRTRHNRLSAGVAWDRGSITYGQASQFAYLNLDGISLTGIDSYADGSTNKDDVPYDTRVRLHGYVNTPSFYATDTLSLGKLTITAAGRYNRVAVDNVDRLPRSAARGTLSSSSVYQRFNPAIGFTYRAAPRYSVYFDYSEASRAPTSIELGCADPNFPCNLPNALVSDPPLQQVVSRTYEVGVRGSQEGALRWSADYFHGQNYQDLLFVASEQTGFGYFMNFGKTRRQGVEANIGAEFRHVGMGGGYTFLSATYQSSQTVNGASNSSNDSAAAGLKGVDADITILPGNRIPQVPQHLFKGFVDYRPTKKITTELNVITVSSSFARGNENNRNQPDGTFYLGSGTAPGYGITNFGGRYQLHPRFQLFVQVNNLLNRRYSTAAQLGSTPYSDAHVFTPRPFAVNAQGDYPLRSTTFLAPGTPLSIYGGIRITLRRK